jgi:hypothetical protein
MPACPPVVCKLSQLCFLGGHREGLPGRGAQGDQELRQVLRHPQVHDLQLDPPSPPSMVCPKQADRKRI